MSLNSWKKEFYGPLSKSTSSWLKATEHSLKKWEGATRANTRKHKVKLTDVGIVDPELELDFYEEDTLHFDGDSCALCIRADKLTNYNGDLCKVCPLYHQEGVDCTESSSAFEHFLQTGSPVKMIRSLRKLRAQLEAKKRRLRPT